jgi:hypothetical protein
LVFAFKFPQWGILRLRTNPLFPQVSLPLHRLTGLAQPSETVCGRKRQKARNSSQGAPYILVLKGGILRRVGYYREHKLAEIEFSVLKGQCLDRRIVDMPTMTAEVLAWENHRNSSVKAINLQRLRPGQN